MTIIKITASDNIVSVSTTTASVVNVVTAGPQGAKGDAGLGLNPGGTTGQVLVKASDSDYDTEWATGGGGGANLNITTPSSDVATTGAIGTATTAARADHVHAHSNLSGGSLHAAATTSAAGFLSATDKTKLDGIASGAQPGTVTAVTGSAPISVANGTSTPTITISAATTSAAGTLSATDKAKLDGVASGATANSTDAYLLSRANHTGTQAWSTLTSTPTTLSGYGITDADPSGAATTAVSNHVGLSDPHTQYALEITIGAAGGIVPLNASTKIDNTYMPTSGVGSGTVTSVSGSAPITVATGTTTPAISISAATTSAAGTLSASDKTKLDGIAAGAQPGTVTTVTGSAPISVATGTTTPAISISAATTSAAGTMSATDKTKLDGISAGASVSSVTGSAPISVATGTSTPAISISAATTTTAGSMSASDKTKLDGVASGATANSTDAYLLSRTNHTGTQAASTITGLATVATTGAYSNLSGLPTLGTAAAQNTTAFATAAQGILADSAVQPANLVASGRVIYVDTTTGTDTGTGHLKSAPLKTITAALAIAQSGDCISIGAGIYTEAAPMIVPRNVSLVGDDLRATEIRPTTGTATNNLFLVDSGTRFFGLTFARHQAGSWAVAFNPNANNTAIGASGVGAYVLKSPYIQNCTSYTAQDDSGTAGSTSDGTTGGGMEVDGAKCAPNSPIRSMVVDSYTQVNLDGPGCLVKNDGYAQLVSFFGTFCSYHVKTESGGQANMSNSTTDFGTYGLVADGRSSTALFSGTGVAAISGANQIGVISLSANRLGGSNRPATGQVFDVSGTSRTVTASVAITGGYTVTFYPALSSAYAGGSISFYQRSQITTGAHTMEYVGAGTNYLALPWNGGVPIQANEIVETNNGRIFSSTTDHLGWFRVGKQFSVNGTTGEVTINTSSFNVSGLNAVGPFSRDGGITNVGVQLREVSNNATLLASTSTYDGNTAPTQYAVKEYTGSRYVTDVAVEASGPLSVIGTAAANGSGIWSYSKTLSIAAATTSARGTMSSADKTKLDGIATGASVTSVGLSLPGIFTVTGSPVTGSGTLTGTLATQNANIIWAGPSTGAAASPTFRSLVAADLPATAVTAASYGSASSVGTFTVDAAGRLTAASNTTIAIASSAVSGLAASATTNTTNATNISSGTLDSARLGTTGTPQFANIGLGVAADANWKLKSAGGTIDIRSSLTASAGVYTLDVQAANEFVTGAAIAGATTINLSNLANIPSGYVWRGVLSFSYTSGTISWFTGNTGATVKWDGGTAITPTASDVETVAITVVGTGSTTVTIEVAALKGRP